MLASESQLLNFRNAVAQLAGPEVQKKPLLPVYEAIHNSIQAIQLAGRDHGIISVEFIRDENEMAPKRIVGVRIIDNGIGFTKENMGSFGQLFSEYKKREFNCKGIGRLAFFAAFSRVAIKSTYQESGKTFLIDKVVTEDNFYDLQNVEAEETEDGEVKTSITLEGVIPLSNSFLKIPHDTIKNDITQHFIPSLLSVKNIRIKIVDDGDYYLDESVKDVSRDEPILVGASKFDIYHLKNRTPHRSTHKVILSADGRSVKEQVLSFLPGGKIGEHDDKFYLNTVVISDYLDEKLNHQRTDFNIPRTKSLAEGEPDLESIYEGVVEKARSYSHASIERLESIQENLIQKVFEDLPHLAFLEEDVQVKKELKLGDDVKVVKEAYVKRFAEKQVESFNYVKIITKKYESNEIPNFEEFREESLVKLEEGMKLNHAPLVSYVKYRDFVLGLYDKLLQKRDDEKYQPEKILHDLLFPSKTSSEDHSGGYFNHNLWLIDDRYAVYDYVASDMKEYQIACNKYEAQDKRYDIFAAYKDPIGAEHNVLIIELKRTSEPLSEENDPVRQLVQYVERIMDGKLTHSDGKRINVSDNTQYFGLVLCDVHNNYFKNTMIRRHSLKKRPDSRSYHAVFLESRLFLEVMNYENLLEMAHARNRVFINKLNYK
ncbi:ATP-binding protein [Oceanidesulfovibrio marinus]|uniref:Histidine kinase-, DNA gyrase B-, and HSP90-like ATPase n=1 Tax=Oceanidesulfovibrio marinus TaxID=370038 RepID=A0ABX6NH80_9BACT|nr:ATP-binding protein [Oceanidesulfovibrio marinus]QJT09504.1 hypothetical protein E8L03_11390 [Oceanidesulfovibrio marinus]